MDNERSNASHSMKWLAFSLPMALESSHPGGVEAPSLRRAPAQQTAQALLFLTSAGEMAAHLDHDLALGWLS